MLRSVTFSSSYGYCSFHWTVPKQIFHATFLASAVNVLAKTEGKLIAAWQGKHHGQFAGMIVSVWVSFFVWLVIFFLKKMTIYRLMGT